jgi:hypothetical protein
MHRIVAAKADLIAEQIATARGEQSSAQWHAHRAPAFRWQSVAETDQ